MTTSVTNGINSSSKNAGTVHSDSKYIIFIYNVHCYRVVVWRKANKAAVKMVVVPQDLAIETGEVLVGFVMKYTYLNTMATLEQKEPQKVDLKVKVFINVGKIVGPCD